MALVYLGLGSNMGNREANITRMLNLLRERVGAIMAESVIVESDPWGYESTARYLNMVVSITTTLEPFQLLLRVKGIELEMGRDLSVTGYSDRPADIDILLYDDLIMTTAELTIPHLHLHERRFVLEPLVEVDPGLLHPAFRLTVTELLARLNG